MGFFKDITSPFSSLGSKIKSGFSSLGKKIKNTDWEQLSYDVIDKNASFVNTLDNTQADYYILFLIMECMLEQVM